MDQTTPDQTNDQTSPDSFDTDSLPDDQWWALEALVARERAGEGAWYVGLERSWALRKLEMKKLIWTEPKTGAEGVELLLVHLTDAGRAAATSSTYKSPYEDMVGHYSAALEEISRLRDALAYEAAETGRTLVTFRSIPTGAARVLDRMRKRMAEAATGKTEEAYRPVPAPAMTKARKLAGSCAKLTRTMWELRR